MSSKLRDGAGAALLGFLLLFSYELSRTAVESVFLARYGEAALPWAWLGVAVAIVLCVALYDRFVERARLVVIFAGASLLSALVLAVLLVARASGFGHAAYFLYVWKDVHIVVLIEIVWTFANVVFELRTARWAYGLFLVVGSVAGVSGGLAVGALAARFGTAQSLWLSVGVLALLAPVALALGRVVTSVVPPARKRASLADAARVIARSRYLPALLLLVFLVQLVVNLVDYTYLGAVREAFPAEDARTAVMGQVSAAVGVCGLVLQLSSGPILRLAGVPLVLLGVPLLLALPLAGFALVPRFVVAAVAKVASKSLDYSLFKASKELLYIPLDFEEKTLGKAAIDMLGYRVAKGGASLLVLALGALGLVGVAVWLSLALVGAWGAVAYRVGRGYRAIVSRGRELRGERLPAAGERPRAEESADAPPGA